MAAKLTFTLTRVISLAGSGLVGIGLATALLALLPAANTAAAPATTHTYPGLLPCNTTLQACIDGSLGGDAISVQPGTYTESLTLDHAVSLLKGAGGPAVIVAPPGHRVLSVFNAVVNSSVVISGLTLAGGHAVGSACPSACGGGVALLFGSQPLFENDVISNNLADTLGGGIYATPGSPLTLIGVTLISNTVTGFYSGSGGGVYVGDNLTATNSQFIRNVSQFDGGGGYVTGTTTLNGGLFQSNNAFFSGGGLYLSGTLTMTGTQFISNSLSLIGGNSGGAIVLGGKPGDTLSLSGGLFQGNSTGAGTLGAGLEASVHLSGEPFINTYVITATVAGTQFMSNSTSPGGEGGGLEISGGLLTVTGARFERNQGGGLTNLGALHGSYLVMTDTDFYSNTGGIDGGAYTEGPAWVAGGTFQNNQGGTGGLAVNGSALISGSRFISNSSAGIGGGAWLNITSTVRNTLFQGNSASNGGGLYGSSFMLNVENTTFVGNHAITGTGGGLYAGIYPYPVSVSDSQFMSNTAATDGGGLEIYSPAAVTNTQVLSNNAGGNGGGMYAICCLTTNGALFSGNHALGDGGGLYVFSLTTGLTGTQFISNSAIGNGGGLFTGGPTTLLQGRLQGNSAASGGGAYAAGALSTQRSAFFDNSATNGGGLYQTGPGGQVVNSLFDGNTASAAGAGLYFAGGQSAAIFDTLAGAILNPRQAIYVVGGTVHVTDTILVGYAAGLAQAGGTVSEDYNLFFGNGSDKVGTISAGGNSLFGMDPLFVNPAADDYHISKGSPAVDHATNAGVYVDYDGDRRPIGFGFDIGFDERGSLLFLPLVRR